MRFEIVLEKCLAERSTFGSPGVVGMVQVRPARVRLAVAAPRELAHDTAIEGQGQLAELDVQPCSTNTRCGEAGEGGWDSAAPWGRSGTTIHGRYHVQRSFSIEFYPVAQEVERVPTHRFEQPKLLLREASRGGSAGPR